MSDIDQAALLELLGGKRNSNAVASLIQNFDIAESALESATNSTGSAAKENEKYLDSILGKVAQFEAAFETLSATFIDSDAVKFVVDAGTTILDIITGLIDALGSLNTIAITAGAALSLGNVSSIFSPVTIKATTPNSNGSVGFDTGFDLFNIKTDMSGIAGYNKALEAFKSGETTLSDFTDAAEAAAGTVSDTTAEIIRSAAAQGANASAINVGKGSLIKFKAATIGAKIGAMALNAAISFGLSIAIQGLVEGLDYLIHREERIAEAAEEAESAITDIQESMTQTTETTEKAKTVIKAFGSEVKLVNGKLSSTTLSSEQLEQYSEAVKNLTDLYPELISGYDAEGNAIIDLSAGYEALEENITRAYDAKMALNNLELDEKMPDIVEGAALKAENLSEKYDDLVDEITGINNLLSGGGKGWSVSPQSVEDYDTGSVSNYKQVSLGNWVLTQGEVDALNDSVRLYAFFGSKGYRSPNFNASQAKWLTSWASDDTDSPSSSYTQPGDDPSAELIYDYVEMVLSEYRAQLRNERDATKIQMQSAWASTNQNLLSYFSSDQNFSEVDSTFGGVLSQIITGANWNKLIGDDVSWDDIKSYVENIEFALTNVSLSNRDNIKNLLSSSAATLTADEYTQLYNDVQDAISDAVGDEDLAANIMKSFKSGAAYSQEDVKSIVESFNEAWGAATTDDPDGQGSYLETIMNLEKEYLESTGESTDELTKSYEEFFKKLESGNPTIAEMAAFLELTSGNALDNVDSFTDFLNAYDDLVDSMSGTRTYNELVENLGAVKDAEDAAYNSYIRYGEAITRSEYDAMEKDEPYQKRVEHYERMKELLEEGRVGSVEFRNLMKEFDLKSVAEVEEFIAQRDSWYADGSVGLENWVRYVYQLSQAGGVLEGIASIDYTAEGTNVWFDLERIDEMAEKLHMTKAEVWEFIRALQVYSENWESMTAEGLEEYLRSIKAIDENNFMDYETMINLGYSKAEVDELLEKLNESKETAEQIRLNKGFFGDLEDAGNNVENLRRTFSEYKVELNIDNEQLTLTQEAVDKMISGLGDPANVYQLLSAWNDAGVINFDTDVTIDGQTPEEYFGSPDNVATLTLDISDATSEEIAGLKQQLEELGLMNITIDIDDSQLIKAYGKACDIEQVLSKLYGTKYVINTYAGSYPGTAFGSIVGQNLHGNASGTNNAAPGYSLLGDEYSPTGSPRPELVVSGNSAYIAGADGPTIGYLNKGDRVYTYSQTKKILRGNTQRSFPAFSIGFGGTLNKGFGAGSLWSSVSSSNDPFSVGSDFESQYKYHQHLLKMEQESQKAYLEWLDKAYKDAFAKGEIDLDDYYKYSEEVFELIRELVQDDLNDSEHYIEMLGHYDGTEKQIISIYRELMSAIEGEIASARAAGLDDNDEYLQSLQKQWWGYYDEIENIQDEISDTVKDSLEDLIELRIKMIKQDLKNEKEALKDKKSYLKDFYDEQKEMLQDAYDEEEYLEEQAEKRKAVYDLQMQLNQLEYDDSAWAQKKKLQLMQELKDAQKELNDFEKDHALEKAQELLDDTYDAQEEEIEKEIELIEDKEDHAKNLRDQAIADLQAADRQMYEDMIEWNAQYGSGIDQDITDAWANATKAMSDYYKLNQEYYEGIDITKGVYPDFLSDNGSWSSNPISGDNPANQQQASSGNNGSSTGLEGSVSGISGSLRYGSRGSDVSALQTALKNMGYYTDSIDGKFGPNTRSAVMAFQRNKGISVDGVVGPNTKQKFKEVGYASGTANATAGIHEVWEKGSEYIFTSANGKRYKLLSGGDKVLNADATSFLYNFANGGSKILEHIVNNLAGYNTIPTISPAGNMPAITMGDIVINGNATEQTVSQIRRAQREQVHTLLKEFGRLRQ